MKTKKKKKKPDQVEAVSQSDGLRSFELIGGPHFEPGEKEPYEKGAVVSSTKDLCKLHPGKFQEVFHQSVHAGIAESKDRKQKVAKKQERAAKLPNGKNVTDQFTNVGKCEVFLDGEYYSLLNSKGKVLVSHKDVIKIQDAINERNAPKDEEETSAE